MMKKLLHKVISFLLILVIPCGFTIVKGIKSSNEHQYHHVNDCMKDNSILIGCFNNCNGFQPFAEEHQHDENNTDVSIMDFFSPEIISFHYFKSAVLLEYNRFSSAYEQQVISLTFRPPLV